MGGRREGGFSWFKKDSEGFRRIQKVSEGFRRVQKVSEEKNKTLKTKTTYYCFISFTSFIFI